MSTFFETLGIASKWPVEVIALIEYYANWLGSVRFHEYSTLLWQKEVRDKSPKSEKVFFIFFLFFLACSTSSPSFEQKHLSCSKILKSRHRDIALISMYMTNTFCLFSRVTSVCRSRAVWSLRVPSKQTYRSTMNMKARAGNQWKKSDYTPIRRHCSVYPVEFIFCQNIV